MRKAAIAAVVCALTYGACISPSSAQLSKGLFKANFQPGTAPSGVQSSNPFSVSVSSSTYTPLSGGTVVDNFGWEDVDADIPVGFNFKILGQNYNTVHLGDGAIEVDNGTFSAVLIGAATADLYSRSNGSPVSYLLTGNAGSRILKIEWRNAGFECENDSLNTTDDSMSTQLWLYEGSNKIEIHTGPSSIRSNAVDFCEYNGPIAGVLVVGISSATCYLLDGDPEKPVMTEEDVNLETGDITSHLDAFPSSGTVYTFTENTATGVGHQAPTMSRMSIYPNPAQDKLHIALEGQKSPARLRIMDAAGRTVLEQNIGSNQAATDLDMSGWPAGIYLVQLTTDEGVSVDRFVKE